MSSGGYDDNGVWYWNDPEDECEGAPDYHQSTTACCPRETIPDSCSCPDGCNCLCFDCNCMDADEEA